MEKSLLGAKTIKQAMSLMKANAFTSPELVEAAFKNIVNKAHLNAFVSVRTLEEMQVEAEQSQKRIVRSKLLEYRTFR